MNFHQSTALLVAILLFGSVGPILAKRLAPKVAEPVVVGSVQYSAPPEPDLMGFVVATDVSSGKELWRQRIYRVSIKPRLEKDVQWVFITSLVQQDHALLITNERGEHFVLDLATKKVARSK